MAVTLGSKEHCLGERMLGIRYAASTIRLLGRLTSGELGFAFAPRSKSLVSKEQMLALSHPLLGIHFPASSQGINSIVVLNKKRLRRNML
jgi:hypothetical protein